MVSVHVHGAESGHAAVVRDSQYPDLEATFTYHEDSDDVVLAGVDVHLLDASRKSRNLRPSSIRDLPIVRWQRAARAALRDEWRRQFREYWNVETAAVRAAGIGKMKHKDLVREPAVARRLRGMRRLALVARLYRENVAAGRPDPAAAVAAELKLNRSTTRSLIHRARKSGLLEPVGI